MIETKYFPPALSNEMQTKTTILLDNTNTPNEKVTFGYAVFQPGDRVPKTGMAVHQADEYSFIIKGEAKIVINGETYSSEKNCAGFIPAGEAHFSYNDSEEPCELVWVLVEK
jgi:mannose-6-phosphate isomerase-like protein (cupin superfamily)